MFTLLKIQVICAKGDPKIANKKSLREKYDLIRIGFSFRDNGFSITRVY